MTKHAKKPSVEQPKPPAPELGKGDWKDAKALNFTLKMEKAPTGWIPFAATCKKCDNEFLAMLKNGDRIPPQCRECGGDTSTWRCEWKQGESSIALAT